MGQAIRDPEEFESLMVSHDMQAAVDDLRRHGLDSQSILAQLIDTQPLPRPCLRLAVKTAGSTSIVSSVSGRRRVEERLANVRPC